EDEVGMEVARLEEAYSPPTAHVAEQEQRAVLEPVRVFGAEGLQATDELHLAVVQRNRFHRDAGAADLDQRLVQVVAEGKDVHGRLGAGDPAIGNRDATPQLVSKLPELGDQ